MFALDWGISLRTAQKVEAGYDTYRNPRSLDSTVREGGQKTALPFEAAEYVETTFEHQYLVKSPGMEDGAVLWWMRPKEKFYGRA